jgi:magnesium transporter
MKTTTLRSFAAPSPTVLSFLRAQVQYTFERSGARCAATKGQAGRYVPSGARSGQLGSCFRRQYRTASRDEGFGKLKSVAAPKTNYVEANSSCLSLTTTRNTACAPLASSSLIHPLSSRRALSTTSSNWWRIWPSNRQQRTPLNSTHQHPLSGLADDAASAPFNLGRVTRPANELKMRCTELDENGSVTMVSGEFKKSELIAKVHIKAQQTCVSGDGMG